MSIWHGVDPLATHHPNFSPYSYCANNPIILIDPNGKDWIISKTLVDGNAHYNMSFKGAILNSSGQKLDMNSLKNNMIASIQSVYSNENISGGATISMSVDLRVINSASEIESDDHLISVYSNSEFENITEKEVNGVADINGKKIGVSAKIAQDIIDGKNNRTVPHEMGHTAGQRHPDDDDSLLSFGLVNQFDNNDDGNLMYGRGKSSTHVLGNKLKSSQLESMFIKYKDGKLNKNTIFSYGSIKNWWYGIKEVSKTFND